MTGNRRGFPLKIEHNSHNAFCRTPFGAAPCVSDVTLRLLLGDGMWPDSVLLRYAIGESAHTLPMHFHSHMLGANVFEAVLTLPSEPCLVFYSFEASFGGSAVYYGNNPQRRGGLGAQYLQDPIPYQITVYDGGFHTPDWLKEGVMYQIFPDRFAKSTAYAPPVERDDIIRREWGDTPYHTPGQFGGTYLANDMFGGSLAGILEKLPYLADLGVTVLYLNPIFEAFSNHKYDTGDYEKVDPMFGDEELFTKLCAAAKELGIRVILDGVFNHTGSDSKYFNKDGKYPATGAYQSKQSPYFDWYSFSEYPDKYECWWGIKTLPRVKAMTPSYLDYILTGENAVIKQWIRRGASGWRLDVVDELPDEFVKILRRELKQENPDAAIIGEVWEDASNKTSYGSLREYFGGRELDSVMNYPLRAAMIAFVMGKIDAVEFNSILFSLYENYPREAFFAAMNFLSSHDTPRVYTVLSGAPDGLTREQQAAYTLTPQQHEAAQRRIRLITQLQFALPGLPSIFYGDEIGTEGFGDPFCRACFDWGKADGELHAFFRSVIAMRKQSPALARGEYTPIYGGGQTCGFLRYTPTDACFVLINTDETLTWNAPVELGRFGICRLERDGVTLTAENGRFALSIGPMCFQLYHAKTKEEQQ